MKINLYNSNTKSKELFVPIDPKKVTMYVCGPTVYSFPHIGNARGPVIFDVLARLLRREYDLTYVRNITDLDDKIYQAADEEGVDISEVTQRYTEIYQEDMSALGVEKPDLEPLATEHIDEMIEMIQGLIDKNHAYEKQGHVFFHVETFDDYGFLSNRTEEEQISGTRIKSSDIKKNQRDFVLWKPSIGETPGWDSPWGFGRPGWHLECSAMAKKYLGRTLDIHGGGSDLLFPHHENECAQSMCSHSGEPLANYWIHNGMIDFDNVKMSKSEGNLLLIRDLLKEIRPEVIRMAFLTTHYRKPINWNDALINDSEKKLDRLYGSIRKLGKISTGEPSESFLDALADDINTPKALSELFAIVKSINNAKSDEESMQLASTLIGSAHLLGLMNEDAEKWFENIDVDEAIIGRLMIERETARSNKDFERADQIRQEIESLGVTIEDGPKGPVWKKR
tara:strand:+ start:205 stop:1560 length:1356 start_codon:yes stop_codon:yes gene_type:complete